MLLHGWDPHVRTPRRRGNPPPLGGSARARSEARSSPRWGRGGTHWSSTQPLLNSYKGHSCAPACCGRHTALRCSHSSSAHGEAHNHTYEHTTLCEHPHTRQSYSYTLNNWGAAETQQANETTAVTEISEINCKRGRAKEFGHVVQIIYNQSDRILISQRDSHRRPALAWTACQEGSDWTAVVWTPCCRTSSGRPCQTDWNGTKRRRVRLGDRRSRS